MFEFSHLFGFAVPEEARCEICGTSSSAVSGALGVCRNCIVNDPEHALPVIRTRRERLRAHYPLPKVIPRACTESVQFKKCRGCVNGCEIHEGGSGFCGLRTVRNGKLKVLAGTQRGAVVDWYYDPLPTNCVSAFVCSGCTGAGYPKYSHARTGAEIGFRNLAVFYEACSFDCAFCQNWHFRRTKLDEAPLQTAAVLAEAALANETSCICYFGGDPTPQLTHSIKSGKLAREIKGENEILRVCWETNGSMPWGLARAIGELALVSGGCIKFDLKVRNEDLHQALCGTSNKNTFENFKRLWDMFGTDRPDPPLLVASTLLVPGYIGEVEVGTIAEFIAELDGSIPYSLLGFHPDFHMLDMGVTRKADAFKCAEAAKRAGLMRVNIGNLHLLG